MNRALRAATMGALLLSPVALSACGAGQVTQTNTQDRDKAGPQAESGDITMRSILLAYPQGGEYKVGEDAELRAAIVNDAESPDKLTSVQGDAFEGVRSIGGSGGTASTPSAFGSSVDVQIPAATSIFLGSSGAPTILLENLKETLTPGQSIQVKLTFEQAGEVTVQALVDSPDKELSRGPAYDFNKEGAEQAGPPGQGSAGSAGGG